MTSFHVTVLLLPMASFFLFVHDMLNKSSPSGDAFNFSLNKSSGGDALSLVLTW